MALHRYVTGEHAEQELSVRPQFSQAGEVGTLPKYRLPRRGMPADTAYQVVHDELMLDGNSRLNLATFVTTWMEPQSRLLMDECADKNLIDKDEYPQSAELERRCVNILAHLWHATEGASEEATGCSTSGSSEACMLGGMALKWRWRQRLEAAGGVDPARRPNLVMGANVQVCWEKFCRYWDVEARLVPVSAEATHLTPEGAVAHCDENTIGVVAVLGSTYDGVYEPVAEIAAALDGLAQTRGIDVPIHVDGASGAFVAPFVDPSLAWDFRVPRVHSINTSGHKYGLVYPGVGWVVWRDQAALPDDLVFKVDYLGGEMPTFTLNFSRPASQVAAQYYNFLRLGFSGYKAVQDVCRDVASQLAREITEMGPFELVSRSFGIPAFAFRLKDPASAGYSVFDVSDALRGFGWIVPAYAMPPAIEDMAVLRIVVRNGFGPNLAAHLLEDLNSIIKRFEGKTHASTEDRTGFHH
ncbi:MAG TPA: glutamate decarboxylase [Acidimicrobiales bacterium]|jgi:glutamate decarboxylase|nr:glutamate decarboxylase [Acidimicrobiales bacterium]